MTPGERAIWAAAFVASYNRRMEQAVRIDLHGALAHSERAAKRVPLMAITEAARMVRVAREALPALVDAEIKPSHRESVNEAIAMLRDMLGVDASGNPYR